MPENTPDPTYPIDPVLYPDDHTPDPAEVSGFAADEDDDPHAHMGEQVTQ